MNPQWPSGISQAITQGLRNTNNLDVIREQLDANTNEIERIKGNQMVWIKDLCCAIQVLYQYWECFQVFKTACACIDFKQIAEQKPMTAYRKICAYYSKQNMECTISQEEVNGCITAAKILCQQGCE